MDEFVEAQMLTSKTASYLQKAVTEKANILISGQDGAGKTSLLRALCAYIPAGEQIITIEARAELQLANTHVIGLETEETDISQIPKISLEALLMTSMRMRPDRLILGSLEGAEAYTWLQAINGGLRGSMTTCSGKNPLDALARIEAMALRANPTALTSIREEIGSAIDLIVHLEREAQNGIRVASISELHGYQNNQFVTIDKC
jgi:pilus assembly protein CpaF